MAERVARRWKSFNRYNIVIVMRFPIKYLMAIVAVAAVLLTLLVRLRASGVPLLLLPIPFLILLVILLATWPLWSLPYRRVAAIGFVGTSILSNLLCTVAATYADYMLNPLLLATALIVGLPVVGAFGVAWARLATQENATPRRRPLATWALVVGSAVMPAVTLWTLWPLRLAFCAVRPGMERLADRAETGQMITSPVWIGPFRLAASAADPGSNSVGLFTDPNPNGRTGFVRVRPEAPESPRFGQLLGTDTFVELGWGWTYRQDD